MVEILCVFSALTSILALVVAKAALDVLREEREGKKPAAKARERPVMNDADRRKWAVMEREHQNFMNYDGGMQMPIDEDTILADSD